MQVPPPAYSQVEPSNKLSVKFTKGQLLTLSDDAFKEIAQEVSDAAKTLDDINANVEDLRSNKNWKPALKDWDTIRHELGQHISSLRNVAEELAAHMQRLHEDIIPTTSASEDNTEALTVLERHAQRGKTDKKHASDGLANYKKLLSEFKTFEWKLKILYTSASREQESASGQYNAMLTQLNKTIDQTRETVLATKLGPSGSLLAQLFHFKRQATVLPVVYALAGSHDGLEQLLNSSNAGKLKHTTSESFELEVRLKQCDVSTDKAQAMRDALQTLRNTGVYTIGETYEFFAAVWKAELACCEYIAEKLKASEAVNATFRSELTEISDVLELLSQGVFALQYNLPK